MVLLYHDLHCLISILEDKMKLYELYILNDEWKEDTQITLIDWRGIHKRIAKEAIMDFQNFTVKCFNKDVVLLEKGNWSDYEKCIKLS